MSRRDASPGAQRPHVDTGRSQLLEHAVIDERQVAAAKAPDVLRLLHPGRRHRRQLPDLEQQVARAAFPGTQLVLGPRALPRRRLARHQAVSGFADSASAAT
jgi:hypothetical protein